MSQTERLLQVLKDGEPHSSFELVSRVYDSTGPSIARLGARIWDLRNAGYPIKSWKDPIRKTMQWYQLEAEGRVMEATEKLIQEIFA